MVGSAVITPATKTFVPNAAGLLAGTLVGNDIISCGTTIGQTWYQVQIFSGSQQVYEKLYAITGATWNIATAVPLSNDPTAFMDLAGGYQLGDTLYGSGTNTLGLIRGNQTTNVQFLCQTGTGTTSAPPAWCNMDPQSASTALPSLSGDLTNTSGTPNNVTVASVGGDTATTIANAVTAINNATSLNTAGKVVQRDVNGNFTAGTVTANLTGNVTGFTGSISGNAATVTDGVYTTGSYSDPTWLTDLQEQSRPEQCREHGAVDLDGQFE